MFSQAVAKAVAAHRFVFIVGTALLAIGTSRLATARSGSPANWLLALGGAALMFCGDQLHDIERTAAELSRTAQRPIGDTRIDVLTTRRPIQLCGLLLAGVGLAVTGLTV